MRRRRSISDAAAVSLCIVRGQLGVDVSVAQSCLPGLTLQGGDGPRERARPGVRTQHAGDEPSDGVAIARVSERLGDLCFDRDCHINGLVHNRLRKKYNSFMMAVPWR